MCTKVQKVTSIFKRLFDERPSGKGAAYTVLESGPQVTLDELEIIEGKLPNIFILPWVIVDGNMTHIPLVSLGSSALEAWTIFMEMEEFFDNRGITFEERQELLQQLECDRQQYEYDEGIIFPRPDWWLRDLGEYTIRPTFH